MAHEPPHDAPHDTPERKAQNVRAPHAHDGGNTAAKWVAGVAGAAILLGGGYFALKNLPQGAPPAEVASIDSAYDANGAQPIGAGAYGSSTTNTSTDVTTASTEAAPVRTTTTTTTRRATVAKADPVPEQVIGVTPASYAADGSDEIIVTPGRRPVWSSTPSARRLSALYPARALERGREGEASIHCTVQDGGSLDCVRSTEMPAHSGFGAAALRVARTFKHAPVLADGRSAAGTPVNLRVLFRISDDGDRRRT